jgi:APA family basic amino acid/polyamine antiporter
VSEQVPHTERAIGLAGAIAIVAGSMLGIGIFLSPPIVAQHAPTAFGFFGLWFLGGLISLSGAAACAELGAMMPKAGGDYTFQRAAFGPSVAFASGWVLFAAIFAGSIATMTVGLCTYQFPVLFGVDFSAVLITLPIGDGLTGAELSALGLIAILTLVNLSGAELSARTQIALTVVPIALLAALALYALVVAEPATDAYSWPKAVTTVGPGGLSAFVLGYMAVYFAYSGWINIIYVAGEVKNPGRSIPVSLLGGTAAVTALYLLLCLGFVHVLGVGALKDSGEAGSAVAAVLGGETGRHAITALIASALVASINATVLGGARVAYAMAQDGAMWPILGSIKSQTHVPNRALWLQALLSSLLVVSGKFEDLYTMVSLAMVVTGTLTVASLFALRRAEPDRERPYRAMGYPVFPAIYILSSIGVVTIMLGDAVSGKPGAWYPLLGLGVLIAAYSFHALLTRRSRSSEPAN